MAEPPKRVLWDACAWIALIQKERITDDSGKVIEDREQLCRATLELAKQRKLEVIVSTLCLVEVCKESDSSDDKIADFFENDYILQVSLDWFVATRARALMQGGYGLKPADASHVATALIADVDEMHTFDAKVLSLNGKLDLSDGRRLKICKPGPSGTAPLFDDLDDAIPTNPASSAPAKPS